jgi:hypothetical protein
MPARRGARDPPRRRAMLRAAAADTGQAPPQGQLAEVEDSYTLIPLDQPARLAQIIREFTHVPEPVREGR